MDPKLFKQKLDQVAEWYITTGDSNGAWSTDNPTGRIQISEIKLNETSCHDCSRPLTSHRVIRCFRNSSTGAWTESCRQCGYTRNPESGKFESQAQQKLTAALAAAAQGPRVGRPRRVKTELDKPKKPRGRPKYLLENSLPPSSPERERQAVVRDYPECRITEFLHFQDDSQHSSDDSPGLDNAQHKY